MSRARTAALLAAAFLGGGCQTSLYDWGRYDQSVFAVTSGEGFDVVDELQRMQTQIEKTESQGKLVPPGVHAHVAYLLVLANDHEGAIGHLEAERAKYPESTQFVDWVLDRMTRVTPGLPLRQQP